MANPSKILLNCILLGDDPLKGFIIETSLDTKIGLLGQAISKTYTESFGGELGPVDLFQCSLPVEEASKLQSTAEQPTMLWIRSVRYYWPEPSAIDCNVINVLFAARNRSRTETSEVISPTSQSPSTELAVFKKLSITQAATRVGIRDSPGASASSQTSNFAKRQKKPETAIYNGRPWARTEKPVEIYHPAFRIFLDKIDEESSVSASDYARTENLLRASQDIYPDEESRRIALVDRLVILLGHDINKLAIPGCTADGVIKIRDTGNALEAFITVLEFKNEIGSSLGDPTVQGAVSYGKYWCQDNLTPITNVSCCPAFIISVAGPWVCIFGAISLSQIIVQPLTEMLWVADHPQKESRMKYLTRVFLALRGAISHLHEYYRLLLRSIVPPYVADPARFFPDIHCFRGRDGNETKFSYTDEFTRLVFKARTEGNRDIVVKFVERYNAEAHELLARQGLAPELLFDGGDVLYGGYRMVVMEFCYGMTYLEYDRRPDGMSQASSELLSIRQTIKGALKLLHEANFVFGDLRKPNILVVEDEKGG